MKSLFTNLPFLCCSILLASCAADEPIKNPTASGKPEVLIQLPIENVRNAIAHLCSASGGMLENSNNHSVICAYQEKNVLKSALLQAAIGNSYSTTPLTKVQYNFFAYENGTKVYVDEWFETQMAFGQVRRVPSTSGKSKNGLQEMLYKLKNQLEKNNKKPSSEPDTKSNTQSDGQTLKPL